MQHMDRERGRFAPRQTTADLIAAVSLVCGGSLLIALFTLL
jgi:hypothetical protein